MTWGRLDDSMPDNPKIVAAGPICELIHVRAICYANRYLTNGVITPEVVPLLMARLDQVGAGDLTAQALSDRMVLHRLWKRRNGVIHIVDFEKNNPTRKEVKDARSRNARRQAKFRNAKSNALLTRYSPVTSNALLTPLRASSVSKKKLKPEEALPELEGPNESGLLSHVDSNHTAPASKPAPKDPARDYADLLARIRAKRAELGIEVST